MCRIVLCLNAMALAHQAWIKESPLNQHLWSELKICSSQTCLQFLLTHEVCFIVVPIFFMKSCTPLENSILTSKSCSFHCKVLEVDWSSFRYDWLLSQVLWTILYKVAKITPGNMRTCNITYSGKFCIVQKENFFSDSSIYTILSAKWNRMHSSGLWHTCYHEYYLVGSWL